jgi:hypothetical protein
MRPRALAWGMLRGSDDRSYAGLSDSLLDRAVRPAEVEGVRAFRQRRLPHRTGWDDKTARDVQQDVVGERVRCVEATSQRRSGRASRSSSDLAHVGTVDAALKEASAVRDPMSVRPGAVCHGGVRRI